jgi:hypothetical protein
MPLDSTRQVLAMIAGSIIGVGGVAFSVTMVALTLTSGQYGPKILRNFLEDGLSKVTLGLFLGTYVYTLIVLTGYAQAGPRPGICHNTGQPTGSARLVAGHQRPRHCHHLHRLVQPWSGPDRRSGLARLRLPGS